MLKYIMFAWAWLSAAHVLLPYLVLTLAAYAFVYLWRKGHPRSWLYFESRLPFAAELSKGEELAHNLLQSLPSVVIAAVLGALASGGDIAATVLGAVAGAGAPLLHHTRKALPFDPYRGNVAPVARRAPLLPLLCFALFGCSSAGGASRPACTPEAHAKETAAFVARVNVVCVVYDVPEECPAYAGLQADFDRQIEGGCQ